MFLFNKLIRVDLMIAIAVILLFFVHGNFWPGFLQGFAVAVFFISIFSHIDHYKKTKKFY
jgi:hypothetical protein